MLLVSDGDAEECDALLDNIMMCYLAYYNETHYVHVPRPRTIVEALTIDSFPDNQCYVQFRFRSKAQLHRLFNCLQVPESISFNDGQRTHKFGGEEVLLFALEYLASGNSI